MRLDRAKMIESYMESQALANRAIELCDAGLVCLAFSVEEPSMLDECVAAAATTLKIASAIAKEAKDSASEGKVELPPGVKSALASALRQLGDAMEAAKS